MVLALVDDLLFRSKIRATADAVGATVMFAPAADGARAAGEHRPDVIVLDLDKDSTDPIGVIRAIRSSAGNGRPRVVGYASHVRVERLKEAREAGCDLAVARSAFVADLVSLFRPGLRDVEEAARRIEGIAWNTPLIPSPWLSTLTGANVWLKLETVQATGSFKIRGAANAIRRLVERDPAIKTVTTASAGNHGLALATAAAAAGIRVRVHLPASAPRIKRDALRKLGAELVEAPSYDEAEAGAREDVRKTGAVFVSAYSHSDVIAGAGTIALEMLAAEPRLDTFLAPVGGGGLLSGTATVVRARRPGALILGAEAEASPVFTAALAAGRPVTVEVKPTLADGLAGNMEPDSQTFGIVRDLVDRVVLIPEPAIERAMRELFREERLIAEGASATAIGALLSSSDDLRGRHVGVILSGRNVDVSSISFW